MSKNVLGGFSLGYANIQGGQYIGSDSIMQSDNKVNLTTQLDSIEAFIAGGGGGSSLTGDIVIGTNSANTITVNSGSTIHNNNETVTLKDNSTTSLVLGSAGNTSMVVLDTTDATPNVNLSSATNLIINNANDSISYTDGTASLVVKGGISCAKRIVGGNITANGNLYASWDTTVVHALNVGNVVNSTYTAPSTSTTTGAIICAGGVGVAGDMNVGGSVTTTHLISTGSVQGVGIASTGNIQAYANTIYGGAIIASGAISGTTITGTGALNIGTNTITSGTINCSGSINCGTLSPQNIFLPTSGGTASTLNYYEEYTMSVALGPSVGGAYLFNGNTYITRIGKIVMWRLPTFTGNSNALGGYITATVAYIISRYRPPATVNFLIPVSISNGTVGVIQASPGMLQILTTGVINIYSSPVGAGTFTSGNGSQPIGDVCVSWSIS